MSVLAPNSTYPDLLSYLFGIRPSDAALLRAQGLTSANIADYYFVACGDAGVDPWIRGDSVANVLQLLGTSLRINGVERSADAQYVATSTDWWHKIISPQLAVVEATLPALNVWYDEIAPVLVVHSHRGCLCVLLRSNDVAERYFGPLGLQALQARDKDWFSNSHPTWRVRRLCAFTSYTLGEGITRAEAIEFGNRLTSKMNGQVTYPRAFK